MRFLLGLLILLTLASPAVGASMSGDYSTTSNPNGDWAYGGKSSPASTQFNLAAWRWADGWGFNNPGHGAPSIGDWAMPALWAKDNSNGLAVVRWTAPAAGWYDITGLFEGADSRGVNNAVYVAVNNVVEFSDLVQANLDSAPFSLPGVSLAAGDTIDFVLAYNGGDPETGWTRVDADIMPGSEPEPPPTIPSISIVGGAVLLSLLGLAGGWNLVREG